MTNNDILRLTFQSEDLGGIVTVGEFFSELLKTLWIEGEGFSGKRPFGNSGWDGDLIKCLITHKVIKGVIDEDGYIEKYNNKDVDNIIIPLIESLYK